MHVISVARDMAREALLRAADRGQIPVEEAAGVWCGRDPRPAAGSALQRLYEAAAAERAEVA